MPVVVGGRCDQIPVHRPVVVLAKGEAIGRMVVPGLREGNEVGGVDEGYVAGGGELDPQAAGGALVVVDFEDLAAEGGAATVFEFVFVKRRRWRTGGGGWQLRRVRREQSGGVMGKVASNEGCPHLAAVPGDGDEVVEAIGEAGVDLAEVGSADLAVDRGGAIGLDRLPETVTGEIAEREVGIALVVVLPDDVEARLEAVAQGLAPWDVVGGG